MSNPYPGYGQQPPQGYGGYGQAPGQSPYPGRGLTGQAAPLPPPGAASSGRRGTSRALPIMAAAGLAVGVCGGLVLVLGTGESDAASKPAMISADAGTGPAGDEKVAAVIPDAAVPPPPPDAAPEPKTKKVTIQFEVEPSDAEATVTVDRAVIADGIYTIELERDDSKTVTIEAKASGYKPFKTKHTITGDDRVPIKLEKRASRTGGSRRNEGRPNTGRDQGGRIDL